MREERNARGRRCTRMYAREKGKARGRRQSAEYSASFFRSLQLSSPLYLLLTTHKTLFVSSSQTMKKRKKTRGKCAPTREVILLFGKKISKIIITFTPSLEGELQISPMNNESVALSSSLPSLSGRNDLRFLLRPTLMNGLHLFQGPFFCCQEERRKSNRAGIRR